MKTPNRQKLNERVKNLDGLNSVIAGADTGSSNMVETIDFRSIWVVCTRYWRFFALGFLATVATAALVSVLVTPIFEATSVVLVRIGRESVYRPQVGDHETVINRDQEAAVLTEVEILNSHDLHESLFQEVDPEIIYPVLARDRDTSAVVLHRATSRFRENLFIQAKPEANAIHVSFRHSDPEITAQVVNTLINLFKRKHIESFSDPGSTVFLESQVADYGQELREIEEAIRAYQLENISAALQEGERDPLLAQRTKILADLKEARSQVAGLRARIEFRDNLQRDPDRFTATAQQANVIEFYRSQLLELRLEEKELLGSFLESNNQVINVREQIKLVEESLAELQSEMQSLRPQELVNDNAALLFQEARVRTLVQQMAQLDAELAGKPEEERRLREFSRDRSTAEENYKFYSKKLEEARILEQMDLQQIASIAVIQKAAVPTTPIRPRIRLNLAIGAMLGIGAGIILAWFAGTKDGHGAPPSFRHLSWRTDR